nr:unnamed protein product [Digitaria exilis]
MGLRRLVASGSGEARVERTDDSLTTRRRRKRMRHPTTTMSTGSRPSRREPRKDIGDSDVEESNWQWCLQTTARMRDYEGAAAAGEDTREQQLTARTVRA